MASLSLGWTKCLVTIAVMAMAQVVVSFHVWFRTATCAPSRSGSVLGILPRKKIIFSSGSLLSSTSAGSSAFSGGFDSDRMEALIQRGELEASLMTQVGVLGEPAPNQNHKKKEKEKKKKEKKKKAPSAAVAARTLGRDGVVKLDGILSPNTAAKLRREILELRDAALASIKLDDGKDWRKYFADVLLKGDRGQRCDLLLPLAHNPTLQTALHDLLVSSNLLYNTLSTALGGDDVTLYELSSLISEPGSPRQPVHPDNPHQEHPPLLTVFVALQDITPAMGPTVFLPRSHTAEVHAVFNDDDTSKRDELLRTSRSVVALLKSGDASLFDSRTLHCGGANGRIEGEGGGATRVLFYASFRNPRATAPIGNVGSMMPDVGRMTLRELRAGLVAAERGRGGDILDGDGSGVAFADPFDEHRATLVTAERGDALAQLKLGNQYYTGDGGVESNREEAVRWFRLASDQGNAQASFNLGVCHFQGQGVSHRDLDRALELFTLAVEGGHPGAKEARDEVSGMLLESGGGGGQTQQ